MPERTDACLGRETIELRAERIEAPDSSKVAGGFRDTEHGRSKKRHGSIVEASWNLEGMRGFGPVAFLNALDMLAAEESGVAKTPSGMILSKLRHHESAGDVVILISRGDIGSETGAIFADVLPRGATE